MAKKEYAKITKKKTNTDINRCTSMSHCWNVSAQLMWTWSRYDLDLRPLTFKTLTAMATHMTTCAKFIKISPQLHHTEQTMHQ